MYTVQNPMEKAMGGMGQAASTYGNMMPNIPKPGPTAGGALMAGAGGAVMGAQAGSLLGAHAATAAASGVEATAATTALGMGPIGWAGAGLALGIGSYLFS